MVFSSVALMGLVGVALWWALRPRPVVAVAPEVQARQELEQLRNHPEDGALLSRASQVLRRYLIRAFELPPNELTTTEFCSLISGTQKFGAHFSTSVSEYLRRCDERKFAPLTDSQPFEGVAQALKLIESGEARRAELRRAEQNTEAAKR